MQLCSISIHLIAKSTSNTIAIDDGRGVCMEQFTVRSGLRAQMIDITGDVARIVRESGVKEGVCYVFIPHTTAGVAINENADPSVVQDILTQLEKLVPHAASHYRHLEGNADAHIKSVLVGCSLSVPIVDGRLALGTWQGIFFCEFDGPRTRRVYVQVVKSVDD